MSIPQRACIDRLDASGALQPNSVLVHGVAFGDRDWEHRARRGASLVWCPASNHFLFGSEPPVGRGLPAGHHGRICLGTDSRIAGAADLLDEMRCAAGHVGIEPADVLEMTTTAAARAFRLTDAGR